MNVEKILSMAERFEKYAQKYSPVEEQEDRVTQQQINNIVDALEQAYARIEVIERKLQDRS